MSKFKSSFNILSLVACENANKGYFFYFFFHTSPLVSMLRWFLLFRITLRIVLKTFSNRESLWGLYTGMLGFLKKKELNDSVFWLSSEIISSFSTNKKCSFETILSEKKRFHGFPKGFVSTDIFFI